MTKQDDQEVLVYIGTYTIGESEGIYAYRMDPSGALHYVSKTSGVVNPSFLAFDPQQRFLYAANEVEGHAGQPAGTISAFSVAPKTGELSFLNQQPSHGALPCHLSVDRTGRTLLVANYGTGSVTVLPIKGDGRLGRATDIVQHEGPASTRSVRRARMHIPSPSTHPIAMRSRRTWASTRSSSTGWTLLKES